jgi:hypothetical protein
MTTAAAFFITPPIFTRATRMRRAGLRLSARPAWKTVSRSMPFAAGSLAAPKPCSRDENKRGTVSRPALHVMRMTTRFGRSRQASKSFLKCRIIRFPAGPRRDYTRTIIETLWKSVHTRFAVCLYGPENGKILRVKDEDSAGLLLASRTIRRDHRPSSVLLRYGREHRHTGNAR